MLGTSTYLARHWVVRVFTEDPRIRAATAAVVPAVATSIVGEQAAAGVQCAACTGGVGTYMRTAALERRRWTCSVSSDQRTSLLAATKVLRIGFADAVTVGGDA